MPRVMTKTSHEPPKTASHGSWSAVAGHRNAKGVAKAPSAPESLMTQANKGRRSRLNSEMCFECAMTLRLCGLTCFMRQGYKADDRCEYAMGLRAARDSIGGQKE